jgi:hypothetical protein
MNAEHTGGTVNQYIHFRKLSTSSSRNLFLSCPGHHLHMIIPIDIQPLEQCLRPSACLLICLSFKALDKLEASFLCIRGIHERQSDAVNIRVETQFNQLHTL